MYFLIKKNLYLFADELTAWDLVKGSGVKESGSILLGGVQSSKVKF